MLWTAMKPHFNIYSSLLSCSPRADCGGKGSSLIVFSPLSRKDNPYFTGKEIESLLFYKNVYVLDTSSSWQEPGIRFVTVTFLIMQD